MSEWNCWHVGVNDTSERVGKRLNIERRILDRHRQPISMTLGGCIGYFIGKSKDAS